MRRRFGRLVRFAPEVAVSVGVTLACFLVFLGLLGVAVRRGTSLDELMRAPADFDSWTRSAARGGIEFTGEAHADDVVAVLTHARNNVKDKPANRLAWEDAHAGLPLRNRHAVQTFGRSRATIAFGARDELVLGENSLVVVKGPPPAEDGRKHASLMVLSGDLDVKLAAATDDSVSVEVETAGAVRVRPAADASGTSEFRVSVDPSGGATLSVFEGRAEVEAMGATRAVEANEAVAVDSLGRAGAPERLPPRPQLVEPADELTISYRERSPRLTFAWEGEGSDRYRLTLARDPAFEEIVYEEITSEPSAVFGNLTAGEYYWRVAGLRGGTAGSAAAGGPIHVVLDTEPPDLDVGFPDGDVPSERITLRGKAEPGADLFIDDRRVATAPDGSFEHTLRLTRGLNVIVIEAIDAAGNVTYRSETVTARY